MLTVSHFIGLLEVVHSAFLLYLRLSPTALLLCWVVTSLIEHSIPFLIDKWLVTLYRCYSLIIDIHDIVIFESTNDFVRKKRLYRSFVATVEALLLARYHIL